MNSLVFYFAVAAAIIGIAVAVRFLHMAWSDYRFQRERRQGHERRQNRITVPMERRHTERRH